VRAVSPEEALSRGASKETLDGGDRYGDQLESQHPKRRESVPPPVRRPSADATAVSPEEALSRGGPASNAALGGGEREGRSVAMDDVQGGGESEGGAMAMEDGPNRDGEAHGGGDSYADRRERNLPGNVPSRGEEASTDALGGADCYGDQCVRNLPVDGGEAATGGQDAAAETKAGGRDEAETRAETRDETETRAGGREESEQEEWVPSEETLNLTP